MFFIIIILATAGMMFGQTKESKAYTCEKGLYAFPEGSNPSLEEKQVAHRVCVNQWTAELEAIAENLRYKQMKELTNKEESSEFHPGTYKCEFGKVIWTTKPGGLGAKNRQIKAINDCWQRQQENIIAVRQTGIIW